MSRFPYIQHTEITLWGAAELSLEFQPLDPQPVLPDRANCGWVRWPCPETPEAPELGDCVKHELCNQGWTGQHLHTFVRVLSCRWPGRGRGGLCREYKYSHSPGEGARESGTPHCVDGEGKGCQMAELNSFYSTLETQPRSDLGGVV